MSSTCMPSFLAARLFARIYVPLQLYAVNELDLMYKSILTLLKLSIILASAIYSKGFPSSLVTSNITPASWKPP